MSRNPDDGEAIVQKRAEEPTRRRRRRGGRRRRMRKRRKEGEDACIQADSNVWPFSCNFSDTVWLIC
jgi:hypothetical protein